jgi:hypothetical protein
MERDGELAGSMAKESGIGARLKAGNGVIGYFAYGW